jgi:hypothetical protein
MIISCTFLLWMAESTSMSHFMFLIEEGGGYSMLFYDTVLFTSGRAVLIWNYQTAEVLRRFTG